MAIFERKDSPFYIEASNGWNLTSSGIGNIGDTRYECHSSIKMFLVINHANSFEVRWEIGLRSIIGNFQLPVTWFFLWRLYHDFFGSLVFVVSQYGTFQERSRTVQERSGTAQEQFRNGSGTVQERSRNGSICKRIGLSAKTLRFRLPESSVYTKPLGSGGWVKNHSIDG